MSFFSREADNTYLIFGAIAIAILLSVLLFTEHAEQTEVLSPEIVMALIAIPGQFVSFAIGKKVGEMSNGHKENGG